MRPLVGIFCDKLGAVNHVWNYLWRDPGGRSPTQQALALGLRSDQAHLRQQQASWPALGYRAGGLQALRDLAGCQWQAAAMARKEILGLDPIPGGACDSHCRAMR